MFQFDQFWQKFGLAANFITSTQIKFLNDKIEKKNDAEVRSQQSSLDQWTGDR